MGAYVERFWPGSDVAPTRRERRPGAYQAFIPDELSQFPLVLNRELSWRVNHLERRLRRFTSGIDAIGMEALSRLLLHKLGIIETLNIGEGIRGWYAPAIFDVLNLYERRVASSQWNTELNLPHRAAPDKRGSR